MRKGKYLYSVRFKDRSDNWGGLLDMLRYDVGQVMSWHLTQDGVYWTVEFQTVLPATEDRWHSFGMSLQPLNGEARAHLRRPVEVVMAEAHKEA